MNYGIELKNITKYYGNNRVINNLTMNIERSKLTILKGRSGSGKTTLLNIMGLLDTGYRGELVFDGRPTEGLREKDFESIRRKKCGFVFQSVALIPDMTAYENIEFALKLSNYEGDHDSRINELLSIVSLEKRKKHMPCELSGGEAGRIAILRAIAHKPEFLFCDEPTGALDTGSGLIIMDLFKNLVKEEGITIVMTTHDNNLMEMGDSVYELNDGSINRVR